MLLRTANPNSQPAMMLHDALRQRMPTWRVLSRADTQTELVDYDAVVWVETDPRREQLTTRRREYLVLALRDDGHPRRIALDRSRRRWAEAYARYLDAYIRRILHRQELRARGVRSRWFSVMPRNGWMLRLGGFVGLSPRHGDQSMVGPDQSRVGGASLRVGRWLTRFLRLDLRLHMGGTENDLGPQGGIGAQLAVVSATGLRMGVALGLDMLVVSDVDPYSEDRYGWIGVQGWLPMELGIDYRERGAVVIQVGPTLTKAPTQERAVGVQASFELEFDFGHIQQTDGRAQ